MTLSGGYYGGGRRRRRTPGTRRVVGWTATVIFIFAAGLYSYRTGTTLAMREAVELRASNATLSDGVADLEQANAGLRDALEEQQRRNLELLEQYQQEIPDESMQRIIDLVRLRLEAGVTVEYMAEVVASAGAAWVCPEEPDSRRFVIQTPTTTGANDAIAFGNGTVTVTGTGISARNEAGLPLAWFDAAQPVTLVFNRIGGDTSDVTGLLPLHHSVVVSDIIYRFSAAVGERSFVNVVAVACDFP